MKYKLIKIKDFFRYDIHQGIKNLIRWFPVIWKDRDWDHWFIYEILRKKLKLTEDFQRDHGICVSHKEIAQKIKVCRVILDRLSKDEYLENALIPHEKKWGDLDLKFDDVPGSNYCEMRSVWSKAVTEEDQKQAGIEFSRAGVQSNASQQQDLDMLFRNMRKYILEWWD